MDHIKLAVNGTLMRGLPLEKKPARCRRHLPAGSRHCPLLPPVEHQ